MINLNNKELRKQIAIMKLLNEAQEISKKLTKLEADKSELEKFNTAIFELALSPVDRIGDTVYLRYLEKHGIKTIREPNEHKCTKDEKK